MDDKQKLMTNHSMFNNHIKTLISDILSVIHTINSAKIEFDQNQTLTRNDVILNHFENFPKKLQEILDNLLDEYLSYNILSIKYI